MKSLCETFTRLMPVWVVLLGMLGFLFPGSFLPLQAYLDAMFFFTMAGIGAVLNPGDFKPILKNPGVVGLGIAAQFVIMPALGFAIGKMLGLAPPLLLGMVLVGSVPGAMASNVIAYLAKTDVAYSIALTSCATLLSPLVTPLLTLLYVRTVISIPFWGMFFSIIKIVIVPLLAGLMLKHYCRRFVTRISCVFPACSAACIAFICALVVALNRDYFLEVTGVISLSVFMHNLGGLVLGYAAAMLFRFDTRRKKTLAIEVGMQNAGLGAVLALKHFSAQSALIPALFATWCVMTASLLAEIWAIGHKEKVRGVD